MRYLSLSEVKTRLNLGKTVEQWLEPEFDSKEGLYILKWIELEKDKFGSYFLRLSQVYDLGGEESLDFYDNTPVDPDEEYEEIEFESLENIIDYISTQLEIVPNKFLNQGMCQEEYKIFLNKRPGNI